MKETRHNKILQIIAEKDIDTQEALQRELQNYGYNVTQATVSRDIRELDLRKAPNSMGKSRYCAPPVENYATTSKYVSIIRQTLISVENVQNMLVIKTYPGMANASTAAFDTLFSGRMAGSIAGDDTIFIIAYTNEKAEELCNDIKEILK